MTLNSAPIGNHDIVQDDRADADQALIADGAAVQDDRMPDRHIVADDQRRAIGFFLSLVRHMPHRQILYVRAAPDHDAVHIAAQHGVAPDGTVVAEFYVADDLAGGMEINPFTENGGCVEVWKQWHDCFSWRLKF